MNQFLESLKDLQYSLDKVKDKPKKRQFILQHFPSVLENGRPDKYKKTLIENYYVSLVPPVHQNRMKQYINTFIGELNRKNVQNSLPTLIKEMERITSRSKLPIKRNVKIV